MRTLSHLRELDGAAIHANRITYTHECATIAGVANDDIGSGIQHAPLGRAVRVVGLLAFGQSLLFLVIWLLVCASAGAATAKKSEVNTDLSLSTYEPVKSRSPLSKSGVEGGGRTQGGPVALQLEGILYEASHPSAIVNGRILTLNKTVIVEAPGGATIQMRAVEITRDKAVVELGGQKIELHLKKPDTSGHP